MCPHTSNKNEHRGSKGETTNANNPTQQIIVINGPANTFAIGVINEIIENELTVKGIVKSSAAKVRERGSMHNDFTNFEFTLIHELKSGISTTIPKVENTESVNDKEKADDGIITTSKTITIPRPDNA